MKNDAFTDFCAICYPLLKSGFPVVRAASVVSKMGTARKETVSFARYVVYMMQTGCSFTYAAERKFPQLRSDGTAALFMVFEMTGNLQVAMELQVKKQKKTETVKRKLWGALLYPSVVLMALMFLCVWLVAGSSAFGITGADSLVTGAVVKGALLLVVWYGLLGLWVHHTFRKDQKERFYRLMGAGLASGTDLVSCLRLCALTVSPIAVHIARITDALQQGVPLAMAMKRQKPFMHEDLSLLEVTGDNEGLARGFTHYADTLERGRSDRQERLLRLVEPLVLTGAGAVILLISREAILPFLTSWGGMI